MDQVVGEDRTSGRGRWNKWAWKMGPIEEKCTD